MQKNDVFCFLFQELDTTTMLLPKEATTLSATTLLQECTMQLLFPEHTYSIPKATFLNSRVIRSSQTSWYSNWSAKFFKAYYSLFFSSVLVRIKQEVL